MNKIELKDFIQAHNLIKPFINETPLEFFKDNIYLKRESLQKSGSFKWSGVLYSCICVFEKLIVNKELNHHFVTQSTGNHAIAMIESISLLIPYYTNKYLNLKNIFETITPVIFGNKNIRKSKLIKIENLITNFKYNRNGFIDHLSNSYKESLFKRIEFLKKNNGSYLQHGGRNIMIGYGSIGIEIDRQLPKNVPVSLYVAVGAGGVLGIGLCLSMLRPTKIISVQTDDFNAFNRSVNEGKLLKNKEEYENIHISDGIAVDEPEEYAFNLTKDKIYKCVSVSSYKVINLHLKNNFSGSTNISLVGLETFETDDKYKVVLDCEGNW